MSRLLVVLLLLPTALVAQQRAETAPETWSLADILSAPFPAQLVAAPGGRAVAWVGDEQGQRNVWVAEAPAWRARRLTRWLADDGQELSELTWTADARALLVVRGSDPKRPAEAFLDFLEKFIGAGIASAEYAGLNDVHESLNGNPDEATRREAHAYAGNFLQHVKGLYGRMDPGFNFPPRT
jgi:hypothetical protein